MYDVLHLVAAPVVLGVSERSGGGIVTLAQQTGAPSTPRVAGGTGGRRLDIQGLRAVAVLMVVAFHAGLPVPGGFIGVDVFFVISGFVITAMLRREWLATGRIAFGRFYARRFKRLTPALALTVAVTMVLSALLLSPFGAQQTAAKTAVGAMLLTANFAIARSTGGYFDAPAETNPLLNTWSLSVEEQFYLAFPALLALGWLLARRARRLAGVPVALVTTVAIASFGLALISASGPRFWNSEMLIGFYSPFSRAWEFAVGALLAFSATNYPVQSRRLAAVLAWSGAATLIASLWLITKNTPFPGVWTLLPVTGTLLVLAAGAQEGNPVSRAIASNLMVRVGDWSYSIYLWHWPLIVFATLLWPGSPAMVALAAASSFVPALASYRWVEQPIRSMAPGTRARFAGLVSVTVLVPIAFAGMLAVGARNSWLMDWPTEAMLGKDEHVAMARGCTDRPFDPVHCAWNTSSTEGHVLLVGDSQAYAFADGVIDAAAMLGKITTVSARSGCPVSTANTTGDKPFDCPAWQREVMGYALRERPDVVVIANRSTGYTRPESGWRTVLDAEGNPATKANAADIYESGLNSVVRTLREAGIGVLILQNIPEPNYLNAYPSIVRRLFPADEVTFDSSRTVSERARGAEAEAAVARANPGTLLFDPIPVLCPTRLCPLKVDGRSVYLDRWHLSRDGVLLLTPSLRNAIREAVNRR